jgi:hypothetical protein
MKRRMMPTRGGVVVDGRERGARRVHEPAHGGLDRDVRVLAGRVAGLVALDDEAPHAIVVRDHFGDRIMGRCSGASGSRPLGMALGPWLGGWIHDNLGSYFWLFVGSSAIRFGGVADRSDVPPARTGGGDTAGADPGPLTANDAPGRGPSRAPSGVCVAESYAARTSILFTTSRTPFTVRAT